MAKTKISEFNANPALNTDIDSINIAEGCAPSGINDAIRELMAQLKDWQAGTSNDPMVIGSSGSLTLNQGTANGVAYLNGSKVVTSGSALTFDGSNLAVTGGLITATKGSANGITIGDVSTNSNSVLRLQGTSSGYNFQLANNLNVGGFELTPSTATGGVTYTTPVYSVTGLGVHAWSAGGSEGMRLTSTGLGIGTSSPAKRLDVRQAYTADTVVAQIGNTNNGNGATPVATLFDFTVNNGTPVSRIGSVYTQALGQAYLSFSTYGSGSLAERMVLDSSGNLGIGTTSPASKLHVVGNTRITADIESTGNSVIYSSNGSAAGTINAGIYLVGSDSSARFYTGNSERARIDSSGNLLVGTTATVNAAKSVFSFSSSSNGVYLIDSTGVSGAQFMRFDSTSNTCGSITRVGTTSAVAYNTSSDYRLKNTIAPMTGALAKVALLKPCTYKWNADGSDGEGFIAHELAEVVPQCVTGEKDAVDAEGNPKYQGIDTSFLVATLTAAIQELNAKFEAYKASHP